MGAALKWLTDQFRKLGLLPIYFRAIAREWMNVLFGETLVGVVFLLWWALANPSNSQLVLAFVVAMFVAGYYAWRADHVRMMPRLGMAGIHLQETPTGVAERRVYVQVEPNCLTTAPVSRCEGHLLRVYKRSGDAEEWRLTEMKERLPLEWSRMGQVPVTLYPSGGQYLNVCHRGSQLTVIIPAVHPLPLRWREVFDSVGTFRFEIEITAEDCEPVHAFVDVSLDDREWNTPDVYLTVI